MFVRRSQGTAPQSGREGDSSAADASFDGDACEASCAPPDACAPAEPGALVELGLLVDPGSLEGAGAPASDSTLTPPTSALGAPADAPHAPSDKAIAAPSDAQVRVLDQRMFFSLMGSPSAITQCPGLWPVPLRGLSSSLTYSDVGVTAPKKAADVPSHRPAEIAQVVAFSAGWRLAQRTALRDSRNTSALVGAGKKLALVAGMEIRTPLGVALMALEIGVVGCRISSEDPSVRSGDADRDAGFAFDATGPAVVGSAGESSGSLPDASNAAPTEASSTVQADMDSGSGCAPLNFDGGSFVNLAVPLGNPLDPNGNDPLPVGDAGSATIPPGWHFYQIEGAVCRDGSSNGIYVQYAPAGSKKLMIYLEGGGACMSPHFCDHNPANIHEFFQGGPTQGESFSEVLLSNMNDFVLQQPYSTGIFDDTNDANPFQGWNRVYVPYCTGDVHFGTAENAMMADDLGNPQQVQFVGYRNMQRFIARVVPTFPGVDQVVLTGASAGGLGAVLNYGLVQDTFGSVPVTVVDDSGPAFLDPTFLATCLQEELRSLWGWDASLPSDCQSCRPPGGGGLLTIVDYWLKKYPAARIGLISSIHDQIFRLFYSAGANDCATSDPNILSGLGLQGSDPPDYPGPLFAQALDSLRTRYSCTKSFGSYYIGTADPDASTANGSIDTLHMHTFRDRFYDPLAGGVTLAKWTSDFVSGAPLTDVGP